MRIGIDARPLQGETQFRGIGKAFEDLLRAVAANFANDHHYVFYVDSGLPLPKLLKLFPNCTVRSVPTNNLGRKRFLRSFLPSYRAARPSKKDVDVFFQYDAMLGVPTSVPTVTIFHDIIPLLFRQEEKKQQVRGLRKYKNQLAGNMYWGKYLRILKQYQRSRIVVAISEASRRDFIEYIGGVKKSDIITIPHGVRTSSHHTASHPSKEYVKLAKDPYLLYVGGIDLRKNIVGLLKTFYELKDEYPKLQLVAVGKEFSLTEQMNDLGWGKVLKSNPAYARAVHTPGFVSDEDLAYLYSHASAFVFASRYEGFGLPPLEAMQAGCPVVAYDNSSIPEVVGDAALLVKDGASLVPAVKKVLDDKNLRTQLITKGKKQAAKFTWENTAKQTLAALKKAS